MLNEIFKSTVRNHRDFRGWFYFVEALDAQLKAILQKSKFGEATPEQIKAAVEELEKEYQDKPSPDKGAAFRFMQTKLGLKAGESKQGPTDPFLLNYYKKLKDKQIFPEEYKTLEYFKDENKELLSEMMEKLRAFIIQNKITLSFDGKPRIKFRNELMDYNDFTQFMGNIHSIEGQLADVNVDKYQNPAFLEMLHKGDLVAKGNNIWVFKGDDPIKCRVMGKGQSWCISSSTSAANYFSYRHGYGQTQYFIFDFNKAPDDPARYVNPGVAPAGNYSEWVDRRNTHSGDPDGVEFGVNGYRSLKEYLAYLQSKGVDSSVFVAEPITQQEKDLQKLIDSKNFEGAKNYPDERKTKDGIPYMFYYYLKIINKLTDEEFDSLSDIEKQEFLLGKSAITGKQAKYIESKGIKFVKEYINSVDNIGTFLKNAENRNEMAKFIIRNKKELTEGAVYECLIAATNKFEILTEILRRQKELTDVQVDYLLQNAEDKDEITKLILQHKKQLTDMNVANILLFAKNKDEMAKLIVHYLLKKDLTDNNVYYLLKYATNPDEMAKLILRKKEELSEWEVNYLLQFATNKNEIAKLIIEKKELSSTTIFNLLRYTENKDEIVKLIIEKKKELNKHDVRDLLQYAKNTTEIAELLGKENINKLSDKSVNDLIKNAANRDEMAKIIQQYK
ncbi:MAG: hypothetical protein RLZZ181_1013 [Pseudomonadota bacterium]